MAETVAVCLTKAIDSVNLINGVNGGSWDVTGMTQAEINTMVQRNVDHLEIILAYDGSNETPNITGSSSSKKTDCTNAINTGKAYISSNS
jgi:hypothetical protein|tara:strand:+ start:1022 stop:1291 length:270 start_codon:yes stop_codon:yes gene_type:complete